MVFLTAGELGSGTSNGIAPSRAATAITASAGTYRKSASGSTKVLISQGQAIRSTLGRDRVIHFLLAS
jgi:hypothetical protein